MRGYIKLGVRAKTPIERWRENQYTLEELEGYTGNIGFACGHGDICVLDIDNPHRVHELGILPFDTAAVRTGSGGYHLYYRIPNGKKVIIHDLEGAHIGELQCTGQYVVVPPSIHPNGTPYTHINTDSPILDISQEELLSIFRGKCKLSDEIVIPKTTWKDVTRQSKDDPLAKVSVVDIWDAKVTGEANGQYFAVHPVHGSTTGHNLLIHPGKNVWQCKRCNSGGGVALAIAVMEGIIDCSDARPGALRGDKYLKVLEVAREKGIIKDPQRLITRDIRKCVIDE